MTLWNKRQSFANYLWYQSKCLYYFLIPFSWIFHAIVSLRKFLYKCQILKSKKFKIPVVVIGNITVGGCGKTPCVIALTRYLKEEGFRPGIISRGYGGSNNQTPILVSEQSDPKVVGDEPLILAKRTACPTVVSAKRTKAVEYLLDQTDVNIIISDD